MKLTGSFTPAPHSKHETRVLRTFIAAVCLAAGALTFTLTKANAFANVPLNFACNKDAGFLPDPNQHQRVGYVTSLAVFGPNSLAADLQVSVLWNTETPPAYAPLKGVNASGKASPTAAVKVVGVISSLTWAGGVGDPLKISMYVSQQNASQIKAWQQMVKKTTAIKSLGLWVEDYDQETKQWFEAFFPLSPAVLAGQLAAPTSLTVSLTAVPAVAGTDVNVYKVDVSVAPPAGQSATLQFANSSKTKVAKSWGAVK